MSSRTLSRAALLLLLLAALAAPAAHVRARNDGAQTQGGRMTEGAQKGEIYDEAGRVVKTTVPTSDREKVAVNLKYDERNRVEAVILDDGTQVGLVYDAAGLWQGFSFPDGGKMLFKRDAAGKVIGFTRVARAARQQARGVRSSTLKLVGFGAPRVLDDCTTATAAAAVAAAVALASCAQDLFSIQCVTATANAAIAAAKAYQACNPSPSESAA